MWVVYDSQYGLWCGDAQTKRMHHPPQCGGDVCALTWGVAMPQMMVWAKAAGHHGVPGTKTGPATSTKKYCCRSIVLFYIKCISPPICCRTGIYHVHCS
jgi:hypothetical protein